MRPRKIFIRKTLAPELLSIFIEHVNPNWLSRPALSRVNLVSGSHDKNIWIIASGLILSQFQPIRIEIEGLSLLDVRVDNHCHSTVWLFNFTIHLANLFSREVLRIKVEVLKTPGRTVFLSPLDVHPKDINWELVTCKIPVPLHDHVRIYRSPLAKVESKHVQQWKRHIARHNC